MNLKDRQKAPVSKSNIQERNKISRSSVNISMDFSKTPGKPTSKNFNQPVKKPSSNSKKKYFQKAIHFALAHKILSVFIILLFACGLVYNFKLSELRKSNLKIGWLDPFKTAINAVANSDSNALKELNQKDGRTNFLLIGVDKRDYNGSLLTDSIMIVSYDHNKNEAAQMSFPRDLYVQYKLGNVNAGSKINAVFSEAYNASDLEEENEKYDDAFKKLSEVLENVTGLPIHYGAMVNFHGLKDIIDNLGGITVDVDKDFIDCQFPNEDEISISEAYSQKVSLGCPSNIVADDGYMAVAFEKGTQDMDGATALRYARSRHSYDPEEGTDFARARRQQKVIQAIKEKAVNSDVVKKLTNLNDISALIGNNLQFYNIGGNELDAFVRSREALSGISLFSMVVDPSFGGYTNQIMTGKFWDEYGGAYLILPNQDDFSEVNNLVKFYLDNSFLVKEDASIGFGYSNANRYQEFVNTTEEIVSKFLKISTVSYQLKITPNPTTTTAPTSEVDSDVKSGKIYKLTDGKDKTIEYYKTMFSASGVNLEVKEKADFPSELEAVNQDYDLFILLD